MKRFHKHSPQSGKGVLGAGSGKMRPGWNGLGPGRPLSTSPRGGGGGGLAMGQSDPRLHHSPVVVRSVGRGFIIDPWTHAKGSSSSRKRSVSPAPLGSTASGGIFQVG